MNDQLIKDLRSKREKVNPKCQGIGFVKEEESLIRADFCGRIIPVEGKRTDSKCVCSAYVKPDVFWREGKRCPLATHFTVGEPVQDDKKRVGQQKQQRK